MYTELAEIVLHHHERHDGKGYPDGMTGEEIPLLSRIMSVADAFDAMTTNRIYKPRKAMEEALKELASLAGSQFHPQVVQAALKALAGIEPPEKTSQLPVTELEKRRFSYFFNDRLTGLFNEDYLQIILQDNREHHIFRCMYIIHLDNLDEYNSSYGWEKGNQFLIDFGSELRKNFSRALLFRVYGNDFSLIFKTHKELDDTEIIRFSCLQKTGIAIRLSHYDLARETLYTINKLDRLKLDTIEHTSQKSRIQK